MEARERTPWAWGPAGVGMLFALIGAAGVLNALGGASGDSPLVAGAGFVGVVVAVVLAIWLYRRVIMRRIARREPVELPAWPWWRPVLLGAAGGVAFMGVSATIVSGLGGYSFSLAGGLSPAQWFELAGLVLSSSVLEELTFRGVALQAIERGLGWAPALLITAAFFGAAHLVNPGATWFGALAIAIEAGLLLGAVFLATRSLWWVIGLHAAWNLTEALLGIPVSGQRAPSLLHAEVSGPDLLTGGDFGIEASVVPMVIGVVVAAVTLVVAHRRGTLGPAFGRQVGAGPTPRS
ncbi:MAG: CPBP family intramembrane metalloprotease [Propionicimonas sp.]|uniref:CPBP family intramembrane glutamic endopeptidase n=1 Tax=Propionicimonas sp. TaxID=1955623 RepID=UPI003D0AD5BA